MKDLEQAERKMFQYFIDLIPAHLSIELKCDWNCMKCEKFDTPECKGKRFVD